MNVTIEKLVRFEVAFNKYWNEFNNYYLQYLKSKESSLFYPPVIDAVLNLQVEFYSLDKRIQKMLTDVDFDIFIHADNEIDMYSFRIFIFENKLLNQLTTIAVRCDSQIILAKKLILNNAIESYFESNIIAKDYNFFRNYFLPDLKKIYQDQVNFDAIKKEENIHYNDFVDTSRNESSNNESSEEKELLPNITEKVIHSNDFLDATVGISSKIVSIYKMLQNFF